MTIKLIGKKSNFNSDWRVKANKVQKQKKNYGILDADKDRLK